MEDIILQYTWPRIDAEVSKHRNHLLKAPFCVHPKTGRVCVPVDPTRIDEFDPAKVPTVGQLLKEIDEAMVVNAEDGAEGAHHLPGKLLFSQSLAPLGHFLSRARRGIPIHAISGLPGAILHPLTSYAFTDHSPPFPHRAAEIDWEKTSLKPYIALLDAHNKALMEETRRRKRGGKDTEISTSVFSIIFIRYRSRLFVGKSHEACV